MLKKILSLFLFLFLPAFVTVNCSLVYAQSGSISGVVTDEITGEPLPGTTVFIQQLDRGTNTDLDGKFDISDVEPGTYILRISFVGYRTQNLEVDVPGEQLMLNIELQLDLLGLDEVVVSSYAPTTKRELTGSVASVRTRDIVDVPLQNPEQLLQGPFSDAMTHAGQLAILRRLAGSPVPSENFIFAAISPENLGPNQPLPVHPDEDWQP